MTGKDAVLIHRLNEQGVVSATSGTCFDALCDLAATEAEVTQ